VKLYVDKASHFKTTRHGGGVVNNFVSVNHDKILN